MSRELLAKRTTPTVTASSVGQAERCAYALYLERNGVRPARDAIAARRRGTRAHRSWTRTHDDRVPGRLRALLGWMVLAGAIALVVIGLWSR